jgi:hypothetical protein
LLPMEHFLTGTSLLSNESNSAESSWLLGTALETSVVFAQTLSTCRVCSDTLNLTTHH